MNLPIIFTLVVLIGASISSQGKEQVSKTEQLVRATDGKLTAAVLQVDLATVDAILADDYTEIDAQGLVRHKADVMDNLRARASAPRSTSIGPEIGVETNFHLYGDTAILIGLTTTRYQHMEHQVLPQPAQPLSQNNVYQERFIKVYCKLNGRWQLAAWQTTGIAKR